jgi:hypothetical protein
MDQQSISPPSTNETRFAERPLPWRSPTAEVKTIEIVKNAVETHVNIGGDITTQCTS